VDIAVEERRFQRRVQQQETLGALAPSGRAPIAQYSLRCVRAEHCIRPQQNPCRLRGSLLDVAGNSKPETRKVRSSMRGSPELLTWRSRLELLKALPPSLCRYPPFL